MSTEASHTQKLAPMRWKEWWITGLLLLLLLVLVLVGMPLLISQQFQKWVLANGGEQVTVENVDLNPFTAEFAIHNTVIEQATLNGV